MMSDKEAEARRLALVSIQRKVADKVRAEKRKRSILWIYVLVLTMLAHLYLYFTGVIRESKVVRAQGAGVGYLRETYEIASNVDSTNGHDVRMVVYGFTVDELEVVLVRGVSVVSNPAYVEGKGAAVNGSK